MMLVVTLAVWGVCRRCGAVADDDACVDAAGDVRHSAPAHPLRAVHAPLEPAAAVLPPGALRLLLLALRRPLVDRCAPL
eukprot:573750-Prorocentrum_minimum.AAC.1